MGRPEHVRCENCCFWWSFDEEGPSAGDGECRLSRPPGGNASSDMTGQPITGGALDWCGEFRAEWPEAPVYDWDNPAHRPIIEQMMHPMIRVQLKDDVDLETAEYVKELRKAYGKKAEEEDAPSTS